MKKKTYITVLILFLVIGLVYLNRRAYFFSHFGNFNDIEILSNNIIDEKFLTVTLFVESAFLATVYDGGREFTIPEEYGPQSIVINYKDSLKCEFLYLKLNRNFDYLYRLSFFKNGNTIYCDINLQGMDGERDTLQLKEIEKANLP